MLSYDITEWGKPLQRAVRETPVPTGTQVLIKVKYSGVCHSDVHVRDGFFELGGGKRFYMTERGTQLPLVLGHEPYGTVVAIGPDAKPADAPIGVDRVVCPWIGCGSCARCLAGNDNLCHVSNSLGIIRNGAYADHVLVPHPKFLVDARGVEPAFAATLACSGITTYAAIAKLQPLATEDWVAIIGAGGLGLQAISILRALGHQRIASLDVDPAKLTAARTAGAIETFDTRQADTLDRLKNLTGVGIEGVIDLVGLSATAALGYAALRKGGRLVSCGLFGGELNVSTVPLAQRSVSVQGSYVGTVSDLKAVIELARAGKLKPIPIEIRPLDQAERSLTELKAGKILGRVVLQA